MAPAAYKGKDLKIPTVKTVCGCVKDFDEAYINKPSVASLRNSLNRNIAVLSH